GAAQVWPPEDPNDTRAYDFNHDEEDDGHALELPDSPWTYENGSVNPSLEPSNAFRRRATQASRQSHRPEEGNVSKVPPYHPDYGKSPPSALNNRYSSSEGSEESDSDEYRYYGGKRRVRRGSEGLEVRMGAADREAILRRYMFTRGPEIGKYRVYKPEPHSPSLSPSPPIEQVPDELPLGAEAGNH
ncbi:uncharacterized protein FOMMEDRAFT_161567, partial [Fomitiporia mediterranea MF3/22]|uniref:uncharacterized protein n=1 Tax=Fomitiporia mediterranea (strain MF3/22) TaxID=694068 RepID=UPI000440814B